MTAHKSLTLQAAICIAITLTACTSTPTDLMSRDSSIKRAFEIDASYQVVLKRLVDQHRECTSGPFLPFGQSIFDAHNYTDLKTATIVHGAGLASINGLYIRNRR